MMSYVYDYAVCTNVCNLLDSRFTEKRQYNFETLYNGFQPLFDSSEGGEILPWCEENAKKGMITFAKLRRPAEEESTQEDHIEIAITGKCKNIYSVVDLYTTEQMRKLLTPTDFKYLIHKFNVSLKQIEEREEIAEGIKTTLATNGPDTFLENEYNTMHSPFATFLHYHLPQI